MKMCFIFSGTFWGLFLVLLGLSVVARALFHINIPFFRLFFAFLFIYVGIKLLVGSFCLFKSKKHGMFSEGIVSAQDIGSSRKYNAVFGQSTLDLKDIKIEKETVTVDVNCVFGALEIVTPKGVPLAVYANAAFADVNLPGGKSGNFGNHEYRSSDLDESKPHLKVRLNVVFGRASFSEN